MMHYDDMQAGVAETIAVGPRKIHLFRDPANFLATHPELARELSAITLAIANEAFGAAGERTPAVMLERLRSASVVAFLEDKGELTGFSQGKFYSDDEILYLDGILLLPKASGGGSGKRLVETVAQGARRIACTTQNPVIFRLLRGCCARVFPSPGQERIPAPYDTIAPHLIAGRRGQFDPRTFVIRDLYPTCRHHPRIPSCRDPEIDGWFASELNIVDGKTRDGFLLIGERKC